MRKSDRLSVLAVSGVAILAFSVTACGSGGSSGSAAPSTPATTGAASPSATGGAAAGTGATLAVADDSKLGSIVTDSKGMTLYRFDKDTASPSKSNCSGKCATLWPAATANGTVSLKGVDKSLVGTITRPDGTKQLTLHGWPLYTFSGDSGAGDTHGQGVGGIWFAATPQGDKAPAMASAHPSDDKSHDVGDDKGDDNPSGSGSSGGYSY